MFGRMSARAYIFQRGRYRSRSALGATPGTSVSREHPAKRRTLLVKTIVLTNTEGRRPLLNSSTFFVHPVADPSVPDVEATVRFLRLVFMLAVCCIVGLSATLLEGLVAVRRSVPEQGRTYRGNV